MREWMVAGERWRPVVGHPHYLVSDQGRVYSLSRWNRVRSGSRAWRRGRILAGELSGRSDMSSKYRAVTLGHGDSTRTTVKVHRLVLVAFVGPSPAGHVADHINESKLDNRLSNLRWLPGPENVARSIRGSKNRMAKLQDADVLDIRRRAKAGELQKCLATEFGMSKQQISGIVRRRFWRHL